MSESSANVTIRSHIAVHIYPIITPHTRSIDMLLTLFEIIITNAIADIAPRNAASINATLLNTLNFSAMKIITTATNNFAPDEIPRR